MIFRNSMGIFARKLFDNEFSITALDLHIIKYGEANHTKNIDALCTCLVRAALINIAHKSQEKTPLIFFPPMVML